MTVNEKIITPDIFSPTRTEVDRHARLRPERQWQIRWRAEGLFDTPESQPGIPDKYILVSCPFTSGDAHMGHARSYSIADSYARFCRARGDAVLFSLGFDAFGLPAELGSIANQTDPKTWVSHCAERMRNQFDALGFSFDWSRAFLSSEPTIYRWSQWLFLVLYENGYIFQRNGPVNWCDSCGTVLAHSQVQDGCCWRCHSPTSVVSKLQWYLQADAYNEENYQRLKALPNWNKLAIGTQRSLLGRVEGFEFPVADESGSPLNVFAPSREAISSASAILISPNHDKLADWLDTANSQNALADLYARPRSDPRGKVHDAVLNTLRWVTPIGGTGRLPILVSPMVDARYGSTAVLVSLSDEIGAVLGQVLANSGGNDPITVPESGLKTTTRYRITAFPISRQRAWGAPIPLIQCEDCGIVPVPFDDLPVSLPSDLVISERGNSLAERADFVSCACPRCGAGARRESDTLDCHFDATWQQLPLAISPSDREAGMFDHPELRRWLPITRYVHGADTGGFVLDERTIAKTLRDLGHMPFLAEGEPYEGATMHGMVELSGQKMSKHLGNVVDPQSLVAEFGADAVRLGLLHAAAPAKNVAWREDFVLDAQRFLIRLDRCVGAALSAATPAILADPRIDRSDRLRRQLGTWCNACHKKVTTNLERLEMHRAAHETMVLLSRIEDFKKLRAAPGRLQSSTDLEAEIAALLLLVQLLAPLTPHVAEDLWQQAGNADCLASTDWPDSV